MIFTTSWDDGNIADIRLAKLLTQYDIKGTFYIPINWKFRSLSDSGLKKISKYFEIGSHSFSHIDMTSTNFRQVIFEFTKSKELLEKVARTEVKCFAYPFGKANEKIAGMLRKTDYVYGRTSKEFDLNMPKNPYKAGISISVSNNKIKTLHPKGFFISFKNNFKWQKIAKSLFLHALRKNKVFHLHGHSWEIENENNWENLAEFINFVAKCKDVEFVTNGEMAYQH